MRKWAVALLSLMLCAPALADGVQYLIVTARDGTTTQFALAERPVITLAEGDLVITCGGTTYTQPMAAISHYAFSTEPSAIDEAKASPATRYEAGHVVFQGLPTGTLVRVVTADGKTAMQAAATSATADIDLSALPSGLYIVTSGNHSIKVMKK